MAHAAQVRQTARSCAGTVVSCIYLTLSSSHTVIALLTSHLPHSAAQVQAPVQQCTSAHCQPYICLLVALHTIAACPTDLLCCPTTPLLHRHACGHTTRHHAARARQDLCHPPHLRFVASHTSSHRLPYDVPLASLSPPLLLYYHLRHCGHVAMDAAYVTAPLCARGPGIQEFQVVLCGRDQAMTATATRDGG